MGSGAGPVQEGEHKTVREKQASCRKLDQKSYTNIEKSF
jgi:hypothetical protein